MTPTLLTTQGNPRLGLFLIFPRPTMSHGDLYAMKQFGFSNQAVVVVSWKLRLGLLCKLCAKLINHAHVWINILQTMTNRRTCHRAR
jgi:hypothetical protein